MRFISLFLILVNCIVSMDLLGTAPTAFILPPGQFEATGRVHRMDSKLDFMNLRDLNGINSDNVGNMDGFGFGFRAGLTEKLTFLFDGDRRIYDYGRNKLNVHSESLALRTPLKAPKTKWPLGGNEWPMLAFQLSYRFNRGSGIQRSFSSLTLNNATFTFNPPANLEFGGIKDEETGFMLIASKQLRPKLLGSVFAEFNTGEVRSELNSTFPITQVRELIDVLAYGQNKKDLGYNLHYQMDQKNLLSLDYHYMLLNRSKDVSDPVRVNSRIDGAYTRKLSQNHFWSLNARYLENQFIGEHSFLYNKSVASRSARNYGYLGASYSMRFGYGL